MNKPMIDKPDKDVLCLADGHRIYDIDIKFHKKGFIVHWVGETGFGTFSYNGEDLDTEFMGEKYCMDIMNYLFRSANKEYKED